MFTKWLWMSDLTSCVCCTAFAFVFTIYFSYRRYLNLETFIIDVNLVFDNCEKFNEDNSDIGRAGHTMRRCFQRRWTELLRQNSLKPGLDTWDLLLRLVSDPLDVEESLGPALHTESPHSHWPLLCWRTHQVQGQLRANFSFSASKISFHYL